MSKPSENPRVADQDLGAAALLDGARRHFWSAPEMTVVLARHVQSQASTDREPLVQAAALGMAAGVPIDGLLDEALDMIGPRAEQAQTRESLALLRLRVADLAKRVGRPRHALSLLAPILEADEPYECGSVAIAVAARCLAELGKRSRRGGTFADAERLAMLDHRLDATTSVICAAAVSVHAAAAARFGGALDAAMEHAEHGLLSMEPLADADRSGHGIAAALTLELVLASLALGAGPERVARLAQPVLDAPVRVGSAGAVAWLAVAVATRVYEQGDADSTALLQRAAHLAEQHGRYDVLAAATQELASIHDDSADGMNLLRTAQLADARHRRQRHQVRRILDARQTPVDGPVARLSDELGRHCAGHLAALTQPLVGVEDAARSGRRRRESLVDSETTGPIHFLRPPLQATPTKIIPAVGAVSQTQGAATPEPPKGTSHGTTSAVDAVTPVSERSTSGDGDSAGAGDAESATVGGSSSVVAPDTTKPRQAAPPAYGADPASGDNTANATADEAPVDDGPADAAHGATGSAAFADDGPAVDAAGINRGAAAVALESTAGADSAAPLGSVRESAAPGGRSDSVGRESVDPNGLSAFDSADPLRPNASEVPHADPHGAAPQEVTVAESSPPAVGEWDSFPAKESVADDSITAASWSAETVAGQEGSAHGDARRDGSTDNAIDARTLDDDVIGAGAVHDGTADEAPEREGVERDPAASDDVPPGLMHVPGLLVREGKGGRRRAAEASRGGRRRAPEPAPTDASEPVHGEAASGEPSPSGLTRPEPTPPEALHGETLGESTGGRRRAPEEPHQQGAGHRRALEPGGGAPTGGRRRAAETSEPAQAQPTQAQPAHADPAQSEAAHSETGARLSAEVTSTPTRQGTRRSAPDLPAHDASAHAAPAHTAATQNEDPSNATVPPLDDAAVSQQTTAKARHQRPPRATPTGAAPEADATPLRANQPTDARRHRADVAAPETDAELPKEPEPAESPIPEGPGPDVPDVPQPPDVPRTTDPDVTPTTGEQRLDDAPESMKFADLLAGAMDVYHQHDAADTPRKSRHRKPDAGRSADHEPAEDAGHSRHDWRGDEWWNAREVGND